ncbi:hypothetical protein [Roseibium litorale]|uniref:Uncharacterized protein n=1 Tax=Roseibium litorale TaxID=2803841 RepID=A0ABR9CLI6_9HYPH|nr:hypothetical protein [Roseibium litorale]MBD8891265.1 hypothetical protein [Roseibium litorale]
MSLTSAWATLCHHCDGIATGTLHEALHELGAYDVLAKGAVTSGWLSEATGIRPGYAALVLKLLVSQGLAAGEDGDYALTLDGQWIASRPDWTLGARQRVAFARNLLVEGPLAPDLAVEDIFPIDGMPERFALQRIGPICAALWYRLSRDNSWSDPSGDLAVDWVRGFLRQTGWHDGHGWTEDGLSARPLAPQYVYPLAYLPTYQAVSRILVKGAASGTAEDTVDRGLDIAFSGKVFSNACKPPVLAAVLPVFNGPLSKQPAALIDTGSGDGTVLAELYEAIATQTERGKVLDVHPLTLVGVEYEEVARVTTERRLAALGCPFHAVHGDIGAPIKIAGTLAALGVDASDALHINKSVLHNRTFMESEEILTSPPTHAVFCDPSGGCISADQAFSSLVSLFRSWKPMIARHGMVCIEAHTVDPARAARHIGRSLITGLDAAHGYSGQLLTEISVHRAASRTAGLLSRPQVDLGHAMMGDPIMSVDHLVLAEKL